MMALPSMKSKRPFAILCCAAVLSGASLTLFTFKRAKLEPLNRFPRMVQEYFLERLRDLETAKHTAKAGLKTKAQAEAYVTSVREKIRECFGPFPEKTPLNARIAGVVQREAYRIEKVI